MELFSLAQWNVFHLFPINAMPLSYNLQATRDIIMWHRFILMNICFFFVNTGDMYIKYKKATHSNKMFITKKKRENIIDTLNTHFIHLFVLTWIACSQYNYILYFN